MNKRIKELAQQSVYYDEDEESWEFDRKKFAELIIQECIKAIETNKANLTFDAYSDAVWEIEDHFKV